MANKVDFQKLQYEVTFIDGADKHKGKGVTLYDALRKIEPFTSKRLVNIRVTFNGKVSLVPVRLVPLKLKRLFVNDIEMEIFAKRLDVLR